MAEERGRERPTRRSEGRPQAGSSRGDRSRSDKPYAGKDRGGKRPPRQGDWKRPADKELPRSEEQARYDGPPIPEEITGKELDRAVAGQLKGLPDKLALRVARHLAAAGV